MGVTMNWYPYWGYTFKNGSFVILGRERAAAEFHLSATAFYFRFCGFFLRFYLDPQ